MTPTHPSSTLTDTLFPSTTLLRSRRRKRMYDRLELGCAQYFVVEDALGKQWAIAWCRQCDGRHCGRFDQRARMFGGMLEFETLAAPRHIEDRKSTRLNSSH